MRLAILLKYVYIVHSFVLKTIALLTTIMIMVINMIINTDHWSSTSTFQALLLRTLYAASHSIMLTKALPGKYDNYPHFPEEKNGA